MIKTSKPEMDEQLPAVWKTGKVKVFMNNGIPAAYLFADGCKFDLPQFCITYANMNCKLLCREYEKQKNDKTRKKLIVISILAKGKKNVNRHIKPRLSANNMGD